MINYESTGLEHGHNNTELEKRNRAREKVENQIRKRVTRGMRWHNTSNGWIDEVDIFEEHYRFVSKLVKQLNIRRVGHRTAKPSETNAPPGFIVPIFHVGNYGLYTFYNGHLKQDVAFKIPEGRIADLERRMQEYCKRDRCI